MSAFTFTTIANVEITADTVQYQLHAALTTAMSTVSGAITHLAKVVNPSTGTNPQKADTWTLTETVFQLTWAEDQLRESPILAVSPDFMDLLGQARRWVMNASMAAQKKHSEATMSVGPVETMSAGVSLLDDEPEFDDTEDMVSEDGDWDPELDPVVISDEEEQELYDALTVEDVRSDADLALYDFENHEATRWGSHPNPDVSE